MADAVAAEPAGPQSAAAENLNAGAIAWAERTCAEQGLSVKVTDPATIRFVAQVFEEAHGGKKK